MIITQQRGNLIRLKITIYNAKISSNHINSAVPIRTQPVHHTRRNGHRHWVLLTPNTRHHKVQPKPFGQKLLQPDRRPLRRRLRQIANLFRLLQLMHEDPRRPDIKIRRTVYVYMNEDSRPLLELPGRLPRQRRLLQAVSIVSHKQTRLPHTWLPVCHIISICLHSCMIANELIPNDVLVRFIYYNACYLHKFVMGIQLKKLICWLVYKCE